MKLILKILTLIIANFFSMVGSLFLLLGTSFISLSIGLRILIKEKLERK